MGKTEKIIIIVTAVILAAIIGVAIFMSVDKAIEKDESFSYTKSNLSQYVKLSDKDYKNYEVEINIAKPRDIDTDVAILRLLAVDKGPVLNDGALITSPVTVSAGDIVYIWYRGCIFDENGEKSYLPGMCNFADEDPWQLEIGANGTEDGFIPGFELGILDRKSVV